MSRFDKTECQMLLTLMEFMSSNVWDGNVTLIIPERNRG